MKKLFTGIMISLMFNLSATIKINNSDINTIAKPEQVISYKTKTSNNVAFFFNDNNLQLGSVSLENLDAIKESYAQLTTQKNNLASFKSRDKIILKSAKDNKHTHAYLSSEENSIYLGSEEGCINIKESILESKEGIYLVTNYCDLSGCFIDKADFFQIEAVSDDSLFKIIKFTFQENDSLPHVIEGSINLNNGNMSKMFIVLGAKKVEILLHPTAFE